MLGIDLLITLAVIGAIGGFIGGIGGPGGIPILLGLNVLLALDPSTAAITASSLFFAATVLGGVLYYYSDGIKWGFAAAISVPAMTGSHIGTQISTLLSATMFELILGVAFMLIAGGVIHQELTESTDTFAVSPSKIQLYAVLITGSLAIGVLAGITGLGGPALAIPLLLVLGIEPSAAVGAGLVSGIPITFTTTVGHAIQGTTPELIPLLVIGVPTLIAQVIGWKYVHDVPDTYVSYTIAGIGIIGGVTFML